MKTRGNAADIAVVGAGACGLLTALRAAENPHLTVVVLEKASRLWSNAQLSGGALAAAGTKSQGQVGIHDSPREHAQDILRKSNGRADPLIVEPLCQAAPAYVDWIVDHASYPLELATEYTRIGHTKPRLHTDPHRSGGQPLMAALKKRALAAENVFFVDDAPVVALCERSGAVSGVRYLEDETEQVLEVNAVILASGGFGANPAMVDAYLRLAGIPYIGAEGSTGDAIRMAQPFAAAHAAMGSYQGHGHVVPGHLTRLNPATCLEGGIVLNLDGQRFGAEDQGYSEFAGRVLAQREGRAVEVWDERIAELVDGHDAMRQSRAAGAIHKFGNWSALAQHFGLPERSVRATADAYEQAVRERHDSLRTTLPPEPLVPPLYASWITGALVHTQGGLVVDPNGRVQTTTGKPVRGLYAGGGAAAGVSGDEADGYLSGNGLLTAFGFGYLIGGLLAKGQQ